ncbi:hypothetical protein [Scytonema sp. PRP1]
MTGTSCRSQKAKEAIAHRQTSHPDSPGAIAVGGAKSRNTAVSI